MPARSFRYLANFVISLALVTSAYSQTHRALLIGIQSYAPPAGVSVTIPSGTHKGDSRFAPGATWTPLHGPLADVASMKVLLQDKFDFHDIKVLTEQDATRQGILAAIDQFVSQTHAGDLAVIYYAGHGSRRVDSLSSKNHFDETIVPIDSWKGIEDIRDKELALRFNRIVYDKHAHLTAIFDSCNSGTMARGVTASVVRALPFDDRDVADEKKLDPSTAVEADLKRIPQDGDAIVLAAAASNENAAEALYSDDYQWHGAFSRALVRVLRSSTQTLSAAELVAQVSNMLHADQTPFQQPSVEGRVQQSLFGQPVPPHPLRARVVPQSTGTITLDMGSAAGFDVGSQFTAIEPGIGGGKTVLEVQKVDEPLASVAKVVAGPSAVKAGQTFELTKMIYPQSARLAIFVSQPVPDPLAAAGNAKTRYPGLSWVDDPAVSPIDFLVVNTDDGWVAYNQDGKIVAPGAGPKGAAFLLLGPPATLRNGIEQTVPFKNQAFTFTRQLSEANYLLAMRQRPGGKAEYALIDRVVLAPHKPDAWVSTVEQDPDDIALNGGAPPQIVCRNDVSFPVRTGWLPDPQSGDALLVALNRRIVRLGKLRVWLDSPGISPGAPGWPFHLAITPPNSDQPITGNLSLNQEYDVRLVATAGEMSANNPIPKYVYLLGFDCAGNSFLLYPPPNLNGDATVPQPGTDGKYSPSTRLGVRAQVDNPLGADTLFLMASAQKLTDPSILVQDGVLDRGTRGVTNPFEELVTNMTDAGTRGPHLVPSNWLIQPLVIPSRK